MSFQVHNVLITLQVVHYSPRYSLNLFLPFHNFLLKVFLLAQNLNTISQSIKQEFKVDHQ